MLLRWLCSTSAPACRVIACWLVAPACGGAMGEMSRPPLLPNARGRNCC